MKKFITLLALAAGLTRADTVTVTVTRELPAFNQVVPLSGSCNNVLVWTTSYNPMLPADAVILTSRVHNVFVDDRVVLTGPNGSVTLGGCTGPFANQSATITSILVGNNGSFQIQLYDNTTNGLSANEVRFSGQNTITFTTTNAFPPDITDTNIEEEVCETIRDCAGNEIDKVCWNVTAGCSTCDSRGSPQSTFGLANFNVRVKDTPIWHDTAVGAPLELELRFSNFGEPVTNTWDLWGELNTRNWPGGLQESFQYGDRGMTNALDRLGIATRYVRDGLGRVLTEIDGATNAVSRAYLSNGVDQVASLWDGNSNKTAWAYDAFGNATNKVYADASQERYQYDRLNRLTNKVDTAGISTGYGYDPNGNLVSIKYGSLSPVTFGFDALNRRTNMVDAVGTTVWTYDALGRLASEKGPFTTNAVTAAYDEHGRMTSVVYGGYSVRYTYDVKGRITGIQAPEGSYSFTYLSSGFKRTQVVYPNGVKETRGYDALTRMTNLVYKKWLTTLLSIDYRYDAGDRRTNEVWSTGRNLAYGYDRAHQLTDVISPTRASDRASYRYDKAGNPIRRTEMGFGVTNSFNNLNQIVSGIWTGGTITVAGAVNYAAGTVTVNSVTGRIFLDRVFEVTNVTVSAGTNVLTAVYHGPAFTNTQMVATDQVTVVVGNAAYTHDANGNLTGDQNYTYQYDLANRLTNVILKASNVSVFAASYDGLGRRIQVVRNGTTIERYVYLPGSFLVLAILDGSNAVKEFYTHGPDLSGTVGGAGGIGGILSYRIGSTNRWLHTDAMGNIILATDQQGKEVGQYRYSPFGRLLNQTGTFTPRFQYSSKERDPESGLLNYGYRYYAPEMGRWLSRDPIGENVLVLRVAFNRFRDDLRNLYLFVENAPTVKHDALGLWVNRNEVARVSYASCKRCGPDVTGDIEQEFQRLRDHIAGYPRARASGYITSRRWFASLALSIDYAAETQNSRIASLTGMCPSPECQGTLTLCGKCVGADVPGNLMFGYAAREFGISILERNLAADLAELWDTIRHWEDWELLDPMSDLDTFALGRRMSLGRITFCQAIEGLPAQKVRTDCQKCDVGCDSFPRAEWPSYPVP